MDQKDIIALKLTARGLVQGRSYQHNGVTIQPFNSGGGRVWKISSNKESLVEIHPIQAAQTFIRLVQSSKAISNF